MENKIIHTAVTKSGKKVSFRYPTINDVEILKNYINKISAEKSFILLQGIKQTFAEEKKWLEEKLEKINKKECVYILALIKDELVACSEITQQPLIKKHIGDFGISVAKKFRGEGIGKILMNFVIKESTKKIKGLKIITLECFSINTIGLNLYKKLGFKEYGRLSDGLKRRGKFEDAVLMYKKVK